MNSTTTIRDVQSRQRLERMKSRLDVKNARDVEDEKFQQKIKGRLQEWNLRQNRVQEEQLKRQETNKFGNRFEDRVNSYATLTD